MSSPSQSSDATVLLRTEHAVARVLACTASEPDVYPQLLESVGTSLGWDVGAVWEPEDAETLRCRVTWQAPGAASDAFLAESRAIAMRPGDGLPGRVWAAGEPMWIVSADPALKLPRADAAARAGLESAFAFPISGVSEPLGVMEFFASERREADDALLATMTSLGSQVGQFVERCRAQQAVRESEARKTAILNAAFDCIVMMDHEGNVVEANEATERTFGYAAPDMVGRELASLIIPPYLRDDHRRGLARYIETGQARMIDHPLELPGMRSDGTEFPVELAVTRPDLPGPPVFCGYLRDVTERNAAEQALRRLATEQAALRRVATAVASETEPGRVFGLVTEEVARLLGAQTATMLRFEEDEMATVVAGWNDGEVRSVPVGTTVGLDPATASGQVLRTGRPARVDSYVGVAGEAAETARGLGYRSGVAAPVTFSGRVWGAVIVFTVHGEPFPEGSEQRMGDFAELAAQALANAHAREELAASRARLVEAGDAERRRLERNLHDGAQQRLVSLSVNLRLAGARLKDDVDAQAALDRAGEELAQALEELRELARGIHPAVLSRSGLEPAIAALAARAPLPVVMDVGLECRLPEPVEAAAYYVVAEAMTNAAKYAHASEVLVRVDRTDGLARIEVSDDGVGGAAPRRGSGLSGLADRVEALGGRLALESRVGEGTTVRAEIPSQ
jgi:PAS domain S-box-containing protein